MRARILRWYGVSCPPDVAIYEGVYFSSNRVVFGQGCFVNARCFFEAGATITLGDAVHVGPGTSIISSTRAGGGHDRRAGALQKFDVQIGESDFCRFVDRLARVFPCSGHLGLTPQDLVSVR